MKAKTALLSLLLVPPLFSAGASAEENAIKFTGLSYPLEINLPAAQKEGAVLFETPFSEIPAAGYDTILLQGEMPEPGVNVELQVRSKSFFSPSASYGSEAFRRFPGGRFWARYRVPFTRQPLKLSVIDRGAKSASTLTIYETELLVRLESKEETAPAASTAAYVPDPELFVPLSAPFKVIRRADWQAAPPTEPYTPHTPKYFTLHHTQAHYPGTYNEAVAEMQFIQDFHQHGRGWIDIAYHFLIDPAGNIFEGRPIKVLGAHVKNRNTANIGISIMGDFHPPKHDVFTGASQDSFVAIGRYLKDTYEVQVSSFYAHRDLGKTACPGDDLYAKKELLRGLIFTPQFQDVPVNHGDVPLPIPAQQESLRPLIQYLDQRCGGGGGGGGG
ncbi:MAG: peptidoglycan recognition family protein, partial [Elusimicrobiota bacterium]|nr:peptidoglycan recognition family protein [Elusimicrobiota bacterium]